MGKTKQNKKNRNKTNQQKKTRRYRGGATPPQNTGANSVFGFDLANYVPSFFKIQLPKFEMPSMFKIDYNPFGTSIKNKCDVCETDECRKDLAKNTATNEPTPPPKTEEPDKEPPTSPPKNEEQDKEKDDKTPTPPKSKKTDEKIASSPPPPPPQTGGKKNKNKNKKTRSRKKKSKK